MSSGTASGSVTKTLDLPLGAAEVWAVLRDFNGLPRWNPGLEKSELGNGGRRRTLTVKAGGTVVEDLLALDDAGRSISYSIIESAVPVSRHKATLSVIERGPNASTVHWTCEFEPNEGVPVETAAGIFSTIFDRGLAGLAAFFGAARQ